MASGKPKNIGEALFGAAGDALNFMAANWGAGQQQKKENALTAYMTSMKAAEQERSVLQHDLMMRQIQQNILESQFKYKKMVEDSLLTPEQKAERDAKAAIVGAQTIQAAMPDMTAIPKIDNVQVLTQKGVGGISQPYDIEAAKAMQAKMGDRYYYEFNSEGQPSFKYDQPPEFKPDSGNNSTNWYRAKGMRLSVLQRQRKEIETRAKGIGGKYKFTSEQDVEMQNIQREENMLTQVTAMREDFLNGILTLESALAELEASDMPDDWKERYRKEIKSALSVAE